MITISIWSNRMNDVGNNILLFSKIYIVLLLKRSFYALDILYSIHSISYLNLE